MLRTIIAAIRDRLPPNSKARVLSKVPIVGKRYRTYQILQHPFDRVFGTDTSGEAPPDRLDVDRSQVDQMQSYIGAQPSIVRRALARLPDAKDYAFVDIGCGKGRPLLVASELPYASVTGVELSGTLVRIAEKNAATVGRRFPDRTAIRVIQGNAVEYRASHDRVVLFYYHAFAREALSAFIANLEEQFSDPSRHAFFVYLNPVDADVIDASARFSRWMTETFAYAPDELGFGPDTCDTVAVWQTVPSAYAPLASAARRLRRTSPLRAAIVA